MFFERFRWNGQFLSDLFVVPQVIVPLAGGAAALLFAWGGHSVHLIGLGLAALLGGLAMATVRLLVDAEHLIENQQAREEAEAMDRESEMLDRLQAKIRLMPDGMRLRDALADLLAIRDAFRTAITMDVISKSRNFFPMDLREQFDLVFAGLVADIAKAHEYHEISKKMSTGNKTKYVQAKDERINRVVKGVHSLANTFEGFQALAISRDESGLDKIRHQLEDGLAVEMETEADLHSNPDDIPDYSKYVKD